MTLDPVRMTDTQHGRRGQVAVIFAGAMLLFVLLAATVIDLSWYWTNNLRMQRAADAAALAGVVFLPGDTDERVRGGPRRVGQERLYPWRRRLRRDATPGSGQRAPPAGHHQRTRQHVLRARGRHLDVASAADRQGGLRPARPDGQP